MARTEAWRTCGPTRWRRSRSAEPRARSALRSGVRVEVLERARLDPRAGDERVDVGSLQPDHPAHAVGGELALVDEPVEGPGGDAQPPRRLLGRKPLDVRRRCHRRMIAHAVSCSLVPLRGWGPGDGDHEAKGAPWRARRPGWGADGRCG